MNKREVGDKYEDKSVEILKNSGYEILDRNYQNRYGEIDIIAKKENYIVFIEVKYRKNKVYGYGYEAVDKKKITKIFRLAELYLQSKEYNNYFIRIDCMSYLGNELDWIKNITWGDEIGI